MKKYSYLIIGGGIAANAAISGVRKKDATGSIGVLTDEPYRPYSRPLLSKGLWKNTSEEKLWFSNDEKNVDILTDHMVVKIDPASHSVMTSTGEIFNYNTLLIATGTMTRELPFEDKEIIYYRDYASYLKLKALSEKKSEFAVVGAGFIGSEIAAALAMNGKKVVLIESGAGIGWRVFPSEIVSYLNEYYASHHVQVLTGVTIEDIKLVDDRHHILFGSGKILDVDGVVAGVGVKANSGLAEVAGLAVGDGVKVNSYLETSVPDIFAAGDVAAFHSPALDKIIRVEHEDNAVSMGTIAGENMAGGNLEYDYIPMFYSDLFDIGYEAVGTIDARLDIFVNWEETFKKGVIYYCQDGFIKGVLLWNEWGKVDQARELIREQKWIDKNHLKGLIA
ncbi:MAG TPA: pyridine nucleotide-disulfide oxidoreductase [Anaerolineaceae bacterium]|nr:pyridine nucleotide-disulfide oxidoreductase [Anaerolineaceae bacterium]